MEVRSFYEFRIQVKEEILDYLPELGQAEVYLQEILKNNGVNRHALQILKLGERCSPSIYLESYYERYRRGEAWQDIMESIASYYWRNCGRLPIALDEVLSFTSIRNQVVYRLVNYDRNEQLLDEAPHIRWHNLAITFRWIAYRDEIGLASSLVTNELIKRWGVSAQELFEVARDNMQEQFPAACIPMEELLLQLNKDCSVPWSTEDGAKEGCQMYVLTNSQKLNGAGTILYPGVLEKFGQEQKADIYLLPSSIHEMILIPAIQGIVEEELQEIVRHTNQEVLAVGDYLSDQIYYYDRQSKQIRLL